MGETRADREAVPAGTGPRRVSFGAAILDERSMKLFVNGREVEIELKPLEALRYLLQHAGEAVTKDDLIKAVWPGRVISDSALTSTIAKLREALGDEGDALKTVHGFGYRLEAEVRSADAASPVPRASNGSPEGQATVEQPAPKTAAKKIYVVTAVVVMTALAGWAASHRMRSNPVVHSAEIAPVAILPCDNLSGDGALDLLAEGIAEEVSSRLSRIRELAIIGRASARVAKTKGLDVRGIGRDLQAAHVLTCSLRKPRDHVRLTAQLVETGSGVETWSSSLDYRPEGTNDATADIAVSVADALLPQLLGAERALLVRHDTRSTEALEAFLLGAKQADLYTAATNAKGIEAFERALQLDPKFARAHVALAYALQERISFEPGAREELRRRSIASVQKALALDPALAEAHAMVGVIAFEFPVDWPAARSGLERALELNPNSVFANLAMAMHQAIVGPLGQAIPFARKAVRLDPLNTFPHVALLRADFIARRYSQCATDGAVALALHPRQWDLHQRLGVCLLAQGKLPEGLAAIRRAAELVDTPTFHLQTDLAFALAVNGKPEDTRKLIEQMRARAQAQGTYPNYLYVAYAGLRDKDRALAELEADFARERSDPYEVFRMPWLDFLRDDPRFIALGRKYGLKPDGTLLDDGS